MAELPFKIVLSWNKDRIYWYLNKLSIFTDPLIFISPLHPSVSTCSGIINTVLSARRNLVLVLINCIKWFLPYVRGAQNWIKWKKNKHNTQMLLYISCRCLFDTYTKTALYSRPRVLAQPITPHLLTHTHAQVNISLLSIMTRDSSRSYTQ